MITKESIINWLKENGIYEQVKNNTEECTTLKLGMVYTVEEILDVAIKANLRIKDFLQMAFDWRFANEGWYFWEEKNKAFQEWVDSQEHRVTANEILGAFLNFLEKHNVGEKFEYNRKNDSTYKLARTTPDESVEAFVNRVCSTEILDPEKLISYAFKWSDTSEGRDFWNKLDEEWIEIYSKL